MWFRLASHLGQPVSIVKAYTSSSDFIKWIWYLKEIEEKEHTKTEWLLAQIAYYIVVSNSDPKKIKDISLSDFLPKQKDKEIDEVAKQKKLEHDLIAMATIFQKANKVKK